MNSELEINDNQEMLEPWLTVIGMLTVFWSPIERYIDQCVSLLSDSENNKKKPLTLNRKLSYIQRNLAISTCSGMDLDALIKVTKSTVQIRDVCVHGVIESFDSKELVIGKVQGKASKYTIEMFTITHDRLNSSAQNLMYLNEQWEMLVTVSNSQIKNG